MRDTEESVESWFKEFSLVPERYSKKEMRKGKKTPDFKVFKEEILQFYCEVKAVVEGSDSKNDTTANQLTVDIHDAYKKFKSVNAADDVPNVLAFVNMKGSAGVDYLEDVITGHWFMESGRAYPFYVYYSEGRIKDEKTHIDLFLWLEFNQNVKFRFTGRNHEYFIKLCKLFDFNPDKISRLNA